MRPYFIRQTHPRGLRRWSCKPRLSLEMNLVVMLGDDLMDIKTKKVVPLNNSWMINELHPRSSCYASILMTKHSLMGLLKRGQKEKTAFTAYKPFVEKPAPEDALATLLSSDVTSSHLKSSLKSSETSPGAGNEIWLTDAIDTLNKTQRVLLVSSRLVG